MVRTYNGSAWSEDYQIISDYYANDEDAAHGNGNILAAVWNGRYSDEDAIFLSYFEAPSISVVIGDVNGDGEITPGDAVAAYELSKNFEWTADELQIADFNGDGEITPMDAVLIYEKSKEF